MSKEMLLADEVVSINNKLKILVFGDVCRCYNTETKQMVDECIYYSAITKNLIVTKDTIGTYLIDGNGELIGVLHIEDLRSTNESIAKAERNYICSHIKYEDLYLPTEGDVYECNISNNRDWTHSVSTDGEFTRLSISLNDKMTIFFENATGNIIKCYRGYAGISSKSRNYISVSSYKKDGKQELLNKKGKVLAVYPKGTAYCIDYDTDEWFDGRPFKIENDKIRRTHNRKGLI